MPKLLWLKPQNQLPRLRHLAGIIEALLAGIHCAAYYLYGSEGKKN
jgi:hypothetical protein